MLGLITGFPRRRQQYTSVRFENATAYIHDEYVDYRFLGSDAAVKAKEFATLHDGRLVEYQDKPRTVVRIAGTLLK